MSCITRDPSIVRGQFFLAREQVFPAHVQVFYLQNNLFRCMDRPALVQSILSRQVVLKKIDLVQRKELVCKYTSKDMQSERQLYGGALSVVLPETARDVSVIRQIPDNQEVFVHPNTDQSFIIEIMEMADPQLPDEMAVETHFKDLAQANSAEEDCRIIVKEQIAQENYAMQQAERCWYLKGEQSISKYNEVVKNSVELHMGVYRVPEFDTDILLSFNDPIYIDTASSSHQATPTSADRWTVDDFRKALSSLKIISTAIFGVENMDD